MSAKQKKKAEKSSFFALPNASTFSKGTIKRAKSKIVFTFSSVSTLFRGAIIPSRASPSAPLPRGGVGGGSVI